MHNKLAEIDNSALLSQPIPDVHNLNYGKIPLNPNIDPLLYGQELQQQINQALIEKYSDQMCTESELGFTDAKQTQYNADLIVIINSKNLNSVCVVNSTNIKHPKYINMLAEHNLKITSGCSGRLSLFSTDGQPIDIQGFYELTLDFVIASNLEELYFVNSENNIYPELNSIFEQDKIQFKLKL